MDPNAQNPQPAGDAGMGMPAAGGVVTPPVVAPEPTMPTPVVPSEPVVPAMPEPAPVEPTPAMPVETPVESVDTTGQGGTTPPPAMPAA